MKHFQILLLLGNLLAGSGVIFYILSQYKKYRESVLLFLLCYSMVFNLLVLVDLSYKYILANMFENQFFNIPDSVTFVLFILVFFTEFGITYTIFLIAAGLKRKRSSIRCRYLFIIWFSVFVILNAFGIIQYFQSYDYGKIYIIHAAWIFSMITFILTILVSLLFFSINQPLESRKLGSRSFSVIFLVGYAFFTLSHLDFYFFRTGIEDFDPLILLLINVLPAFWLRFYYTRQQKVVHIWSNNTSLQTFIEEYDFTSREQEIIEMIIEGKSNKDIENKLFISINTVKNHVYNIFKKAKVNSRIQLIQKIR